MTDQRDIRREYTAPELRRGNLAREPLSQFRRWLDDALAAGIKDATAMALATANGHGVPSVRIVLLKHFDADGFCWYTDYRSRKGIELEENPLASCLFHWREFDRQVRITGTVVKLDEAASAEYFDSRPAESRFSAAASRQSAVIGSRRALEDEVAALKRRYPHGRVPKPAGWGGYRLQPQAYEFWQGRESRLHDRFQFTRRDAEWMVERLQP